VEILNGVLARSSSNGNEQVEHLDVNQLPIYCLYVFCLGAIKMEELALYAAAEYPNVVGMDIARQIPDFAGQTAGWLSGAFSGIRDAELLPFASSAWPDGEKASESEAAAELGLEILMAIAVCSAFVPAVLGFVWRLLFGTLAQEREQLRLQLRRQVLYFGRFAWFCFADLSQSHTHHTHIHHARTHTHTHEYTRIRIYTHTHAHIHPLKCMHKRKHTHTHARVIVPLFCQFWLHSECYVYVCTCDNIYFCILYDSTN